MSAGGSAELSFVSRNHERHAQTPDENDAMKVGSGEHRVEGRMVWCHGNAREPADSLTRGRPAHPCRHCGETHSQTLLRYGPHVDATGRMMEICMLCWGSTSPQTS